MYIVDNLCVLAVKVKYSRKNSPIFWAYNRGGVPWWISRHDRAATKKAPRMIRHLTDKIEHNDDHIDYTKLTVTLARKTAKDGKSSRRKYSVWKTYQNWTGKGLRLKKGGCSVGIFLSRVGLGNNAPPIQRIEFLCLIKDIWGKITHVMFHWRRTGRPVNVHVV